MSCNKLPEPLLNILKATTPIAHDSDEFHEYVGHLMKTNKIKNVERALQELTGEFAPNYATQLNKWREKNTNPIKAILQGEISIEESEFKSWEKLAKSTKIINADVFNKSTLSFMLNNEEIDEKTFSSFIDKGS